MLFALGFTAGLVTAGLLFVMLAYFKNPIEKQVRQIQKKLENAGPRPRGYVFEPEDEADEVRQQIIEKNRRNGRDTSIADLI